MYTVCGFIGISKGDFTHVKLTVLQRVIANLRVMDFETFTALPAEVPPPDALAGVRIARLTDEQVIARPDDEWPLQATRLRRYGC